MDDDDMVVGPPLDPAVVRALGFRPMEGPEGLDHLRDSTVVDLSAERNRREQPDAEFVRKDDSGRPMYLYLLQYQMDGKTWGGVDVWAYSQEDAEARVSAMRETLILLGQCFGGYPA